MIKKITKIEIFVLVFVYILFPMIIVSLSHLKFHITNIFVFLSIFYCFYFVIAWIAQTIFKREYLPAIFNCHQKCERSFIITHKIFRICNRCLGIFIGIIITPFVSIVLNDIYYCLIALVIPLIIDGIKQYKTNYISKNLTRIITGVLFGVGFVSLNVFINVYLFKVAMLIIELIY